MTRTWPAGLRTYGPSGARLLETPDIARARVHLDLARRTAGIVVIEGPGQVGKTVATAVLTSGTTATHLLAHRSMSRVELRDHLLARIGGLALGDLRGARAEGELGDALRTERTIVIDNVDRLDREVLDYVLYLKAQQHSRVTLVLTGGEDLTGHLERHVGSLSHTTCRFTPLEPELAVELMPEYHDIYRGAPPRLLSQIDADFAGGLLGRWAQITATIVGLADLAGIHRLTSELLDSAATLL